MLRTLKSTLLALATVLVACSSFAEPSTMFVDQFIQHQKFIADKLLPADQHAEQQAALLQATERFLKEKKYKLVAARTFVETPKLVVIRQSAEDTVREHYVWGKNELLNGLRTENYGALANILIWRMGVIPVHRIALVMAKEELPDGQGLYAYLEVEKID